MNGAPGMLESLFGGAAAGIIGFAFMLVMFMPKVYKWYKGRKAKNQDNPGKPKTFGARCINRDYVIDEKNITNISDHPEFGEPVAALKPDKQTIFFLASMLCLPLIVLIIFVPFSHKAFYLYLTITIVFAIFGINQLFHLADHLTFYRTGVAGKLNGNRISIDYNAIYEHHERSAMLPWMAPTYLMRLDDNRLIVVDGTFFAQGKLLPRKLLGALSERVINNQSQENLNKE